MFDALSLQAILGTKPYSVWSALRRKLIVQRRLTTSLRELGTSATAKLIPAWDLSGIHHARLMKSSNGTLVGLNYLRFNHDGLLHAYCSRLAPLLMMFGATSSVKVAIVDVSDGEECGPGIVGYCSRSADAILVPDIEFYYSRGYAKFREPHSENRDWATREETLVWRGSTTGLGVPSHEVMSSDDPTLLPRTRMCLLLRNHPGTDVRLSKVVHSGNTAMEENWFCAANIFGAGIASTDWWGRKYALDIDGNSNAWSNLFTRLLMGCCVIKVASAQGYRQWYYDELTAWEHFVPVAPDMSDLLEKVDWCRSNNLECREIAARGQEFARRRTFETETRQAARRIEDALKTSDA